MIDDLRSDHQLVGLGAIDELLHLAPGGFGAANRRSRKKSTASSRWSKLAPTSAVASSTATGFYAAAEDQLECASAGE